MKNEIISEPFHETILNILKSSKNIKDFLDMKKEFTKEDWETLFHMIKHIEIPKKRKEKKFFKN